MLGGDGKCAGLGRGEHPKLEDVRARVSTCERARSMGFPGLRLIFHVAPQREAGPISTFVRVEGRERDRGAPEHGATEGEKRSSSGQCFKQTADHPSSQVDGLVQRWEQAFNRQPSLHFFR